MMIVRCPECQTVFRMRPEQLRTHAGMVRCGSCYTPFNALDNLMDEALRPAAHGDVPTHQDPTSRDVSPPPDDDTDKVFVLEDATALNPFGADLNLWDFEAPTESPAMEPRKAQDAPASTFDRVADRLEFEIPDAFLPSTSHSPASPPLPQRGEPEPALPEPERESGTYSAAEAPSEPADTPSMSDTASHAGDVHPALAAYRPLVAATETPEADADAACAAETRDTATPAEATPAWPERDAWRRPALYETAPERPAGHRWLWGLGVGILMGALAAQAAFLFRQEITRSWPQLRPAYVGLCAQFGCTVPLPRVAGAIRITSSHLESDPANPTRFVLNARVHNLAPYAQEHPYLELTLTDTRERPVVRRVLLPAEWVAEDKLDSGFGAGEEIEISLPFEATGVTTAVGYRVYAFFP